MHQGDTAVEMSHSELKMRTWVSGEVGVEMGICDHFIRHLGFDSVRVDRDAQTQWGTLSTFEGQRKR